MNRKSSSSNIEHSLIDVHLHVGRLYVFDPKPLTPRALIAWMNRCGIERAALLPIESPEETHYYITTETVLDICRKYPDRFIPFCNIDPRIGSGDNSEIILARLARYKELGCKGLGEFMSGLTIDDVRMQRVYAACGKLDLPIIFHMDEDRNVDEVGFPALERMLRKFPGTVFVGHGQHFWAEISGNARRQPGGAFGYPTGPIRKGGSIVRLLSRHDNLYADLSAGSAYNALTRDSAFGYRFVDRFQDKLFLGTDVCVSSSLESVPPIIQWLRTGVERGWIQPAVFRKLVRDNAVECFKLDSSGRKKRG